MKRKVLSVFLAAVLMTAVVGCGKSQSEPATDSSQAESAAEEENKTEGGEQPAQEASAAGDVDLSIMWWGADARHEATMEVLEMYSEKTGVTFTEEYTGWDGFWQKLPVLAASNSMTDVLQMDAAYIHQYVDNGQLADLTDLVDLSALISEEEIEAYKINGKIYGIPLSRNGQGLVYSKTKLESYGIDEPKNGWTWDEMIEWARAAAEKCPDGVYPLYDIRYEYQYFQEYVQSHGGKKTLDGTDFNFDKAMYTEFMDLYTGLVEEGICPPVDVSLSYVELDPVNDTFLNGKTLLRSISVGSISSLAEMVPDDELGTCSLPQGDGGSGWCQSTIFFAVGANSQHIKEAADFIQYFISDVDAGKALMTVRGLPLSDEVYESFSGDLNQYQLMSMQLYKSITGEGVNFTPYWDDVPTAFTSWGTEYKAQSQAVMLGQTTSSEAADYLDEIGQEIVAEAAE